MSPAARTSDPATSHAAARSVRDISLTQNRILAIIRYGDGITDEGILATYRELAAVKGWVLPSEERVRTARKELADRGDIHVCVDDDNAPILKRTQRNRWAQTWAVTA